ncbi:hypothetical protein M5689_018081 [Euphorbia peplus]|nr:hypothetical protein M5689_018081 [Euphorbia peplus]
MPPSPDRPDVSDTSSKKPLTPAEFIASVAAKIASEPLSNPDHNVWGVLTAISGNTRNRRQVRRLLSLCARFD